MKCVIVDSRISDKCSDKLRSLGYQIIPLPPSDSLDLPVASHPDMILNFSGDKLICHRSYYQMNPALINTIALIKDVSISLSDEEWNAVYPRDVLFNAISVGDRLICRKKSLSSLILSQFADSDIIDVPQGYAACSVCAVSDNAIITSDISIADAASARGIDVLVISPGHISLPGYDVGFIGGCSGIDGHRVFFTGNVFLHPDGQRIFDFCSAHGVIPVSLSHSPLSDLGKLMFI